MTRPTGVSPAGLAFLRAEEGVRSQVYNDATSRVISSYSDPGLKMNGQGGKGYPTIAMGLALITPELRAKYERYLGGREKLTGSALQAAIDEAIKPRERQLNNLLATVPTVTQSQYDALFSWLYNRGAGNKQLKAAIALLRKGDAKGAAKAITAAGSSETVGHIAKRRAREAAMFLEGRVVTTVKWGVTFWVIGGLLAGALILRQRRLHAKLLPAGAEGITP